MTTRRDFLKQMRAASLAAMAVSIPTASWLSGCRAERRIPATADSVILLWMAGGMAHTETFDPKRFTPFEKGLESKRICLRKSLLWAVFMLPDFQLIY